MYEVEYLIAERGSQEVVTGKMNTIEFAELVYKLQNQNLIHIDMNDKGRIEIVILSRKEQGIAEFE